MVSRRVNDPKVSKAQRPAATTPEARERQLVALAFDRAEQRIRDGTASAQEVTHFLKLGSSRETLEQERLAMEVQLMEAKMEQMASAARVEELFTEAIAAMRSYSGQEPLEMQDDYDD